MCLLLIVLVEYAIEKQQAGNEDNTSSPITSSPGMNLLKLGLGTYILIACNFEYILD